MNIFTQALHADYKRFFQNIKEYAEKENKNAVLMTADVALCSVFLGSALTDYFNYEFYKHPWKKRKEFAVVKTQDRFYQLVNPTQYKKTFTVKPNFLREFAEYVGRDWVLPTGENFDEFNAFLDKHDTFMCKPVDGLGGGGIYKSNLEKAGDRKAFYDKLIAERYFLEEVIKQCDALAAFNPSSVNSIRVMTHNIEDNPTIFFCSLRVGNGNTVVDNFHSGGMSAVVDNETGVIQDAAIDKSMRRFEKHPVSGIEFKGFQIPCWPEVIKMVHAACRKHPEMTVIGWDVCITDNGPILIEGNRRPGFDMVQVLLDKPQQYVLDDITAKFLAAQKKKEAQEAK
jgi:hypothetical protein